MKPARFEYHAPTSVDEAVQLLGTLAAEDGRILAGGQSLVPTMAFRLAKPGHLIDINAVRSHAMPPGNVTEMTLDERQVLAAWLAAGAPDN